MNCIAFFCDAQMLPGLHAALTSLLINHISNDPIHIILFADGLSAIEKDYVEKTFQKNSREFQSFEIRQAPQNMRIDGANSLVGNFTTYGRLYLGDLLPNEEKVLYLDSDIIVNYDITKVFEQMTGDYTLFVSGVGERNWSLDKQLYQNAGLKMDENCFNAGILGINLKKWRSIGALDMCLANIQKYPNQFLSADQAVLNVTFHNDFKVLSKNINIGALATYPAKIEEGIYHFIGLPKPWHPLMKKYHKNYSIWEYYIRLSSFGDNLINYPRITFFIRQLKAYKRTILQYYKS